MMLFIILASDILVRYRVRLVPGATPSGATAGIGMFWDEVGPALKKINFSGALVIESFSTENRKTFPDGAGTYIASAGNTELTDADLAAFQYCTDLVYLDLDGNKITDLSFLKNLPKPKLGTSATIKYQTAMLIE